MSFESVSRTQIRYFREMRKLSESALKAITFYRSVAVLGLGLSNIYLGSWILIFDNGYASREVEGFREGD
jgi:hypothetical protein